MKMHINFTEIWLSERARKDLDALTAKEHFTLIWDRHDGVKMKGFSKKAMLWSLKK